jgi:hypothetical protein
MLSSNFAQSGTALTPMNSPALSSNANCARAHASLACGIWRDYAKNAVENKPMRQKKFRKGSFGLRPLQPPEITQNRQSFLWKSLEENRRDLEKLGEKAWARLYFDIFAPLGNARGAHRELARDTLGNLHISIGIIPCRSGKRPRAHEMWLRSLSALLLCRAREDPMAKRSRPEMAPQRLEKIESAPGNGMVSEASNPLDLVRGRAVDRARLRLTSRKNDKVESCETKTFRKRNFRFAGEGDLR